MPERGERLQAEMAAADRAFLVLLAQQRATRQTIAE
jgi:hypothetical protein